MKTFFEFQIFQKVLTCYQRLMRNMVWEKHRKAAISYKTLDRLRPRDFLPRGFSKMLIKKKELNSRTSVETLFGFWADVKLRRVTIES